MHDFVSVTTTLQERYLMWNGLTFTTNDILMCLMVLTLVYTAVQAFKTRKATAQATILTVLPILLVELKKSTEGYTAMRLKNVGHGPAFNIRIDDLSIGFMDNNDWRMKMNISPDHLLAGESTLIGRQFANGKGTVTEQADLMSSYINHRKGKPIELVLYFEDVTGKGYVTVADTGQNQARIRKPSRPYGLIHIARFRLLNPAINFALRHVGGFRRWYEVRYQPTPKR